MVQATNYDYDLFISYCGADREWVEGYLLDALKQANVHCRSEGEFPLGTIKLMEFEHAIKKSQRTLLVLSPDYMKQAEGGINEFVELLAQVYSLEQGTSQVIPLILKQVPLPPRLNMLVQLSATDQKWEEAIKRLCTDLGRPVPTNSPKPRCPYPGMLAFREDQSNYFFGRDQEVKELLDRLHRHRFLSVIGASGSGKSSLVFAGMIPALKQSGLFGTGNWRVCAMRPGKAPLVTLETTLGSDPTKSAFSVAEVLRVSPPAERLLLVIDQFEEVFTPDIQEAVSFQETLLNLVKTPNCYIILTVRADFYAELMASPLWGEIQSHRLEITPMDKSSLRDAIIEPAKKCGVFVEPALVDQLITDASGEDGVLPLVQETLVLLWEHVEWKFLPLKAYEALSSVSGTSGSSKGTGLEVALARHANAVVANLNTEQKVIARRIFLRLVQFGEGRPDTRRQQSVNDLRATDKDPELFDKTLNYLATHRLLTLSGDQNTNRKADIAHEALITGWPTLQEWLTERREAEKTRRRLAVKAQEWVQRSKGRSGLLDDVELPEAQRWLESPDATDLGVDPIIHELVDISNKTIQDAKQQELEKEKKARENAQKGAIVLSFISVVMVVIAYAAYNNMREANKQSVTSLAETSESSHLNKRQLEALLNAMQAGIKLQESSLFTAETDSLKPIVTATLSQAISEAQEFNRFQGRSTELKGNSTYLNSISFSPDGQMIASGSNDGAVILWSREGKLLRRLDSKGHTDSVKSVAFSPDGKTIASGSKDQAIILWNQNGRLLKRLLGHSGSVNSIAFSPDGQTIASGSDDQTVRLWSVVTGKQEGNPMEHTGMVKSVSFSPDGKRIASTENVLFKKLSPYINIWERDNQQLIRYILAGDKKPKPINSISFSPDGKTIASGSKDKTVRLWNLDGQQLKSLGMHKAPVNSVAFSPDGRTIASASDDKTIILWSLDGQQPKSLEGHTGPVNSVAFSPDGQTIASASDDKTIILWSLDGQQLKSLEGHTGGVNSVAFSPDGQAIASASDDSTVKLWSLEGKELKTLTGHGSAVTSVSFSPDGKTIASASLGGGIRLWSLDGQLLKILKEGRFNIVSFSPDSKKIAYVLAPEKNPSYKQSYVEKRVTLLNFDLDDLLLSGCHLLHDYLKTNPSVNESERKFCDSVAK